MSYRGVSGHTTNQNEGARWRAAVLAGPGFRGRRRLLTPEAREALAGQFREAGEDPPPFLLEDMDWRERRAKLFEAGSYPDKGVEITPEDLQKLEDSFDRPVPVLIEHAASPLHLGFLTEVEAEGHELFGTVALTASADRLVRQSGAESLSLGLAPDLSRILEVSLVRTPRVESARLFSGRLEPVKVSGPDPSETIARFVREGRLTPAQAPYAEALMRAEAAIEFGDDASSPARLLIAMLERQPPLAMFADVAPSPPSGDYSSALMMPEEAEFYRRHFPDISLDQIARRKVR